MFFFAVCVLRVVVGQVAVLRFKASSVALLGVRGQAFGASWLLVSFVLRAVVCQVVVRELEALLRVPSEVSGQVFGAFLPFVRRVLRVVRGQVVVRQAKTAVENPTVFFRVSTRRREEPTRRLHAIRRAGKRRWPARGSFPRGLPFAVGSGPS